MKHFFASLLLAIIISFGVLPTAVFAVEADDPEFEAFLGEIGWEKEEYIDYLESKDWGLDYYWEVSELGTPLSEEGIQPVLEDYDLSRDELNELLVEFQDIEEGQDVLDGDWIIFNEELYESVGYYLGEGDDLYTGTPIDEENLQVLLDEYGFGSEEELEAYLYEYGDSLDYYGFIEDLESSIEYYNYDYEEESYGDDLSDLTELYGSEMAVGAEDAFMVLVPMFFKILFD